MKKETRFLVHFIFCCIFLIPTLPGIVTAAQEIRTALVIGNSAYSSGPLKNPANDAADMATMLKNLGFSVTLNENCSLQEMDEAIEAFGNRLKRGGVGLFYYAGHGVQVNGTNYLLPIGAKINKETDVKYQAVDANKILDEMATANNGLNIVILDACRDNPFALSFRNAARGLAIVSSAPSGTFISYSTSPGNVARDGAGRNSPYTAALLEYMQAPGLTINDVFVNVRAKVKKETGQVPWELSSLEGRFYFKPQGSKQNNLSDVPPPASKMEVASTEKMAIPLPDKPSIAVLPLVNMSGDPKEEYLSDGITDQIINSLSKMPSLLVIARNSTFVYKGKPIKVQKVAEDLGVRYVLEGSVQRSGDRLRITAQLIDALTGHHMWSERYDRELKDIFVLQDEITIKILRAMRAELTDGEQSRVWVTKGRTDNLKALEKTLQGLAISGGTKQDNDRSRSLFEEAIALDPNFIWPYVNLGWTHFWAAILGWSESSAKSLQMASELAQKVLAMDDSIDVAHSLLASIYLVMRQHDKAFSEAERAVTLNPNGAMAISILAGVVGCSGRWEESVLYANKSIRLNPIPPIAYYWVLGRAHFMMGQYDEAIVTFRKMLQMAPDFLPSHIHLAGCYSSMGRDAEAAAATKEVLRINPKFSIESYAKTLPYKNKTDVEREVAALQKAGLK